LIGRRFTQDIFPLFNRGSSYVAIKEWSEYINQDYAAEVWGVIRPTKSAATAAAAVAASLQADTAHARDAAGAADVFSANVGDPASEPAAEPEPAAPPSDDEIRGLHSVSFYADQYVATTDINDKVHEYGIGINIREDDTDYLLEFRFKPSYTRDVLAIEELEADALGRTPLLVTIKKLFSIKLRTFVDGSETMTNRLLLLGQEVPPSWYNPPAAALEQGGVKNKSVTFRFYNCNINKKSIKEAFPRLIGTAETGARFVADKLATVVTALPAVATGKAVTRIRQPRRAGQALGRQDASEHSAMRDQQRNDAQERAQSVTAVQRQKVRKAMEWFRNDPEAAAARTANEARPGKGKQDLESRYAAAEATMSRAKAAVERKATTAATGELDIVEAREEYGAATILFEEIITFINIYRLPLAA